MIYGDSSFIKQMNRALIVSKIIEHGSISRTDLAKVTGLNKSTLSVQAADLLAEGLIIETHMEHNHPGRKPISLSLNEEAGYALGIDLDGEKISFVLSNLLGVPVCSQVIEVTTLTYNEILEILAEQIKLYKKTCDHTVHGLIGAAIGIHGIVDNSEGISYVLHYQWHNKNIKDDLISATGLNIYVQNNANLSAYGETVFMHHRSDNLISLSLHSGIGLGMMVQGEILKGYHGFAGEIGHMIIVPHGRACSCGNVGCWEQYASESSFLRTMAITKDKERVSLQEVEQWIQIADPITVTELEIYLNYIATGLNNMINLFNPEVLILNSQLLKNYPDSIPHLKSLLISQISQPCELRISELGDHACVMGACAFVIKSFLGGSELRLRYNKK
ncbi:ROK family transcriptional regulator [Paenibacillus sp. Marseille-Q4541]|uniref:ROK family transcriptional regulator n=1 Tax=Paenibacillus sp. Marseille-Q4541 TaxID=2831522 RepID=UPI001BAC3CA4|nr:ROK family transcriptional regulator [Paenibacillus sp. Marseille-Q4541]